MNSQFIVYSLQIAILLSLQAFSSRQHLFSSSGETTQDKFLDLEYCKQNKEDCEDSIVMETDTTSKVVVPSEEQETSISTPAGSEVVREASDSKVVNANEPHTEEEREEEHGGVGQSIKGNGETENELIEKQGEEEKELEEKIKGREDDKREIGLEEKTGGESHQGDEEEGEKEENDVGEGNVAEKAKESQKEREQKDKEVEGNDGVEEEKEKERTEKGGEQHQQQTEKDGGNGDKKKEELPSETKDAEKDHTEEEDSSDEKVKSKEDKKKETGKKGGKKRPGPAVKETNKPKKARVENFPTTLEGFNHTFRNGKLIDMERDSGFVFEVRQDDRQYNQARYEALGEAITEHVYKLLETEAGLKKRIVPFDFKQGKEAFSFVFASGDVQKATKLMILIHGSGVVRAGQWARRLIMNDCLSSGTQLPYIKRATEEGYGVLVLNTNRNTAKVEGREGVEKPIKGNSTPEKHAEYVWKNIVEKDCQEEREIYIVAHSYGGIVATHLANDHLKFFKKHVKKIAFTDSVHNFEAQHTKKSTREWVSSHSKNWVSSSEELGTEIPTVSKNVVPKVSAGTMKHEETSHRAMDAIFKYFTEEESTAPSSTAPSSTASNTASSTASSTGSNTASSTASSTASNTASSTVSSTVASTASSTVSSIAPSTASSTVSSNEATTTGEVAPQVISEASTEPNAETTTEATSTEVSSATTAEVGNETSAEVSNETSAEVTTEPTTELTTEPSTESSTNS